MYVHKCMYLRCTQLLTCTPGAARILSLLVVSFTNSSFFLFFFCTYPSIYNYSKYIMPNLYETLFQDHSHNASSEDVSMDIINQLFGHIDFDRVSKYFDIFSYNNLLKSQHLESLNIIHLNSRSLPKNYDNIVSLFNSLHSPPDIIAVTETWLTDTNKNLFEFSGYHSYHLVRNTRQHGGVSIFTSKTLHSQQIEDLTIVNDQIEINTVKINTDSHDILICATYRPNSKHIAVEEFTQVINTFLENIAKNNKIVLVGDFNINLLEHSTHIPTNNFLANVQAINFTPLISRPTRFPDSSDLGEPSLLDHIYTNFNFSLNSGILHFPISDHLPVFLHIFIPAKKHNLYKKQFRMITTEGKQLFSDNLNSINWTNLFDTNNVNTNFSLFLNKIQEIYNQSFPLKTKYISEKRVNNPWISQAVLNSIKFKNALYKDFKIGIISGNYYKTYRNILNKTIKNAKTQYYMNIFTNFKNNTRKIWITINQLGNNIKTTNIDHISYNNNMLTNKIDIAEAFNDYYVNIAPELDQNIPPSNTDPLSYLQGNYLASMAVPTIFPQDVVNIINTLENKKVNINEIPVSLLKTHKHQLSVPIATLFNESIINGKFPQCLKHANVIPIYKKGPQEDLSNYRPISLLNTFSKIFEKLMKKNLLNYLDSKSVINNEQFGFRHGLNTFNALSTFTDKIYSALDAKQSLLSIYIDFSKAFDTVRHDILLKKLNYYGIRGIVLEWFRDYLTNRTQTVRLGNHYSTPKHIQYGVPQGSVLGPILFLLYINDLPYIFNNFKTILFADDSTLYLTGHDSTNMIHNANNDLNIFYEWCICNRLTVNLQKTYYMFFTNKPVKSLPPLFFHYSIIKRTTQHTLLGIIIDESLTFKPHISYLCLRLSRLISLIYHVKNIMPNDVLKILYNAHILPVLYYCTPIWGNTYPTNLIPLFRLQKKILRIITNSGYWDHTKPLFKSTNILTLFDLNKLYTAIYMYKTSNNNQITLVSAQHNYPTRTRANLRIPQHNLSIFKHSLSYNCPITWNSIPENIKLLPTLNSFKKQYKMYLLSSY